MTDLRICPSAWSLYDAWCAALNARPIDKKAVSKSRREYVKHREDCPNCDPIESKRDNDVSKE